MRISVNNSPFDATIEKESTVGEAAAAISRWFGEKNMTVTGIEIDGVAFDMFDDASWQGKPIEQTDSLELTVMSNLQLRAVHISTLADYIALFEEALSAGNNEVVAQLIAEYPPVRASLDSILNPGSEGTPISNRFDQLLTISGVLDGRPGPQVRSLLEFFHNLRIIIMDRLAETTGPVKELTNVIDTLDQLVPVLEELPVLLQTGKDGEAMQHIITFTELTGKLTRLIPYVRLQTGIDLAGGEEAESFGNHYLELNPILTELTEAFDSLDAVLIGDLVEYEIAPRIGAICAAIRARLAEAQKQS